MIASGGSNSTTETMGVFGPSLRGRVDSSLIDLPKRPGVGDSSSNFCSSRNLVGDGGRGLMYPDSGYSVLALDYSLLQSSGMHNGNMCPELGQPLRRGPRKLVRQLTLSKGKG